MYDEPMSLEDLLSDDQRRRAAYSYVGLEPEANPAKPDAPPMEQTQPKAVAAAQVPSDFSALAQRYLEAQKQDRREALFSRTAAGLDAATRVINAGAGFTQPSMLGGQQAPSAAQGVEDAARIEALGLKSPAAKAAAGAGRRQLSTDSTSAESKAAQKALLAQFKDLTPEDVADVPEAFAERFAISHNATLEREGRKAAQDASTAERTKDREQRDSQFAKRLGLDYAKMDQDERLALARLKDAQDARDAAAAAKASAETAKDEKGQTVPAGEAASIGQAKAALDALDVLGKQFIAKGASSVGGLAEGLLPWDTDPKKYDDDVLAAAQAVGTILEGGKLAAGDEVKYRKMFPAKGDSLERARNKLENVKRLIESLTGAKVEALGAAGYNVSGFKPKAPKPERTTPDKVLPKDAAGNPTLDAPPPKAGKVRVREKATGRMKDLSPDAAAKVLADPAYEKVTP